MLFRRTLAVILTLFFVAVSMLMFLLYGLGNTVLSSSFYSGPFSSGAYDFLVKVSADRIITSDFLIAGRFTPDELAGEIKDVFTADLFNNVTVDLSKQLEKIKFNPRQSVVISLKVFRASLLTVANNLAFKLFKNLPACQSGQSPQIQENNMPTCVPEGVEFNAVASPLSTRFQKAIYSAVPEQIQYDFNSADGGNKMIINFLEWGDSIKFILYVLLLVFLVGIALLVYSPFVDILKYEGMAFGLSGVFGYLMGFAVLSLPKIYFRQMVEQHVQAQNFAEFLFGFLSADIQKISLIFLAFGVILLLMQTFLKRKI